MNYAETMKALQKGGIEAEDANFYEPARIKINKVIIDDGDHPSVDHPLINAMSTKPDSAGIVWIVFDTDVKLLSTNTVIKHMEVMSMYTASGRLAYSDKWTSNAGEEVPESKLHEIVRRCKEYDEKQAEKLAKKNNKFVFDPEVFAKMVFEIDARKIKDDAVILATAQQIKKDAKYMEEQKAQKDAQHSVVDQVKANESAVKPLDDDELPF